jgi:hypothetical protein
MASLHMLLEPTDHVSGMLSEVIVPIEMPCSALDSNQLLVARSQLIVDSLHIFGICR